MKLGIAISAAFVLVLVVVVVVKVVPRADPPTNKTSPERLAIFDLPDDMPRLYKVTDVSASAMTHYRAAIDYFNANRDDLQRSRPKDEHIDKLAEMLIAGMEAGNVPDGFLDKGSTIQVGMGQNTGSLPKVASAVSNVLEDRMENDDFTEQDSRTALALFALGERAFRKNVLLSNRQLGLSMMIDGGGFLGYYAIDHKDAINTDDLFKAGDAVNTIIDKWTPKLEIVLSADPHVGDLLNIAKNDKDRSFRIIATAQLGVAKFTDGNQGNRNAIASYLEKTKQSDDAMLAEAARVADALTRDDFKTLR